VRWMIYTGKMNAALFIAFLTRLIAGATKKVFLIVDNLSVHEATAVKEWLADKKERIEVFSLPKYETIREPLERLLHKGTCSEQHQFPVTTTGV
jgi:hypothetical protein